MALANLQDLVDLERFELSTSSMPWKRAPNCATGPLRKGLPNHNIGPAFSARSLRMLRQVIMRLRFRAVHTDELEHNPVVAQLLAS